MFLMVVRAPRPDASYWPGRRWLAAIDAIGWPVAWVVFVRQIPGAGIVGAVAIAAAVLCAIGRLHRAWAVNERYWFTTWRYGRILAAVWLVAAVIKLWL